uniref:Uncharacterized protein n=1 Tax=Panagrellus redivivus TaxID=6233 RepID=A0A7E4VIU2_PANRE
MPVFRNQSCATHDYFESGSALAYFYAHFCLAFRRHDDAILFHEIQIFEDQGLQNYGIDGIMPQAQLSPAMSKPTSPSKTQSSTSSVKTPSP